MAAGGEEVAEQVVAPDAAAGEEGVAAKLAIEATTSAAVDAAASGEGDAQQEEPSAAGSIFEFREFTWSSPTLADATCKEDLKRWNLDELLCISKFSFGRRFADASPETFLADLVNSSAFRDSIALRDRQKRRIRPSGSVTKVSFAPLRASVTSMSFFDRFQDEGIVTAEGDIRKCLDEVIEGVTLQDLLREAMVNEDSENSHLFDDEERDEFMFQLARAVMTGGSMCQYDDKWQRYLDVTKRLYKDMLAVEKAPETGRVTVRSTVFRLDGWTAAEEADGGGSCPLFPERNMHNSCFVAVDDKLRTATVWYHPFIPFW